MSATHATLRKAATTRFLRSYIGRINASLTLLLIISLCVWLQIYFEYENENRIAEKIKDARGRVYFQTNSAIEASTFFFPFQVYRRIECVDLSYCKKVDGLLEEVKHLSRLQILYVNDTPTTDADLEHLSGLSQLRAIGLQGTLVSDAGLRHLKAMSRLNWLDISNTQISDAGLEHLEGMMLTEVNLERTNVTEAGLAHLITCPFLFDLILADTQIGDKGVEHLKKFPKLQRLRLIGTSNHRAKLQESLPNCTVFP